MRYFILTVVTYLLCSHWGYAEESKSFQKVTSDVGDFVIGETIYVPVYSHIYVRGKNKRMIETTLSIRNTDMNNEIIVSSVRYYDTDGKEVEVYLDAPYRLLPLATTEFVVEQNDMRGGSGANFVVKWAAPVNVAKPIVEAVMVGISGTHSVSFIRSGHVIEAFP